MIETGSPDPVSHFFKVCFAKCFFRSPKQDLISMKTVQAYYLSHPHKVNFNLHQQLQPAPLLWRNAPPDPHHKPHRMEMHGVWSQLLQPRAVTFNRFFFCKAWLSPFIRIQKCIQTWMKLLYARRWVSRGWRLSLMPCDLQWEVSCSGPPFSQSSPKKAFIRWHTPLSFNPQFCPMLWRKASRLRLRLITTSIYWMLFIC